jgi:Effector Associated Constant Component 1
MRRQVLDAVAGDERGPADGGTVELRITPLEPVNDQELVSLYRWLSRDAALGRHGRVSLETVTRRPGEMGGAFDVINAVFADASALAGIGGLLLSYRTWRDTRSQAPRVRIEKDGVTIEVENGSEEEVRRIVRTLLPGAHPEPGTGAAGEPAEQR